MKNKNLIVTCALPYANGSIHLGHLVEHIQADIWVRFKKMQGVNCHFICADDTHGTPVMLKAKELGITPEEMIASVQKEHITDFNSFNIGFSHYYTTHSEESKELVYDIYQKLQEAGKIVKREIQQLFDETEQIFLPDRFIKGTCPKCHSTDQYGDSCEVCGAIYAPTDLIDYYSTISGNKPVLKASEHYFFKLSECGKFLQKWLDTNGRIGIDAKNKMQEWLDSGLQDWDISRDKPYFGFQIPSTTDKYFYVWLDAPVGYFGTLLNYCKNNDLDFNALLNNDNTELYHFIGKDILYFHALFWPSVLYHADYKTPTGLFVHGFLTVNGQKMSKSRGTFITAQKYIESGLNPTFFRYYIASKSTNRIEDIDLSLDDFVARVNSELVGKFINIASRSSGFLTKIFAGKLASEIHNLDLLNKITTIKDDVATLYNEREYSRAIKLIMHIVDEINLYVDNVKPWVLAKEQAKKEELHQVCSILLNAFRYIAIYLKPIVPSLVADIEKFLNIKELLWSDADTLLLDYTINPYSHLITRIDPTLIEKLTEK